MKCSCITEVGLVRRINEDYMLMDEELCLFGVADGMGGHQAGEIASLLAIETVLDQFRADKQSDPSFLLRKAVESSNQIIYQKAQTDSNLKGMGTTITIGKIVGNQLILANVGDSRCYLYRNSHLQQISHDHSYVAELVNSGMISEEEGKCHPQRNVLTRALGTCEAVSVDIYEYELLANDKVLFCTDGLHGIVSDEEIKTYLDANKGVKDLKEMAMSHGAPDNITIVMVEDILLV